MIDSFLKYLQYEKNYSVHTVNSYRNDLLQFVEFVCGGEPAFVPREIDEVWVRRWMAGLMEEGYSALSVKRKLSSLKSFFRYLAANRLIDKNPLHYLKGPKAKKPLPAFVKDADMDTVISDFDGCDAFEDVRDRAVIDVFYSTGMRCSELTGLTDGDVDFDAGLLRVNGKRNKQRLVPFAENLKNGLKDYISLRNKEIGSLACQAFFVRRNGKPLSHTIVYGIVHRHLSEIPNLTKRSPHVLRHTFATSMLNNGAGLNSVKELLGHASLSSTEVYTHNTFEELKRVYHQAHPRA
ncbi:MAG: tyrosine-type recombinase/integrase [Dysgonamonadaceae bacterium]|jgi:integrase/recombinase XerC|nr:tyrosine-type recombinase/integrase [Dysgonamonadaceae bacterium]